MGVGVVSYEGGPAFPSWDMPEHLEGPVHRGMTLHEWYVGQALSNPSLCTGVAEERDIVRWFGENACAITRAEIAAKQAGEIALCIMFQRGMRPA